MRLIVDPREDGQSVEALLTGRGGLPASVFAEVLRNGGVMLNRRRVARPQELVHGRDELVAHVLAKGAPARGPQALDASRVLFLNDDLIAVDKPPGIPAQGTEVDAGAGLDAAVRALLAQQGQKAPFVGLVHRLDLETSGVTIFGRTPAAVTELTRQFREGLVRKRYVALVSGRVTWSERHVDGPIGADPVRQGAYCVSPRGRPASTDFSVLEHHGAPGATVAYTKLEARPLTGRTHQIRVHAQSLGHPLLGDRRYAGPEALTLRSGQRLEVPRVALHAADLWCTLPSGKALHLSAPWPDDLREFEAKWLTATGTTPVNRP